MSTCLSFVWDRVSLAEQTEAGAAEKEAAPYSISQDMFPYMLWLAMTLALQQRR